MAKLRVLAEKPPMARGNPDNQLRELRDYLYRVNEELEYLLTHLDTDNFDKDLQETVAAIPTAPDALPLPSGEASAGSSGSYARADHVHPVRPMASVLLHDSTTDYINSSSADPLVITLSESADEYSLLWISLHKGGTTGPRRGAVLVPTATLLKPADYTISSYGETGWVRIGRDAADDAATLRIYGTSFAANLYLTQVYGLR